MNKKTMEMKIEEAVKYLDVKLEGFFNDAVRQVMIFVRKEQTEEEMEAELKSLSDFGLKIIENSLTRIQNEAVKATDEEWKMAVGWNNNTTVGIDGIVNRVLEIKNYALLEALLKRP